jgi:hypothetical protein
MAYPRPPLENREHQQEIDKEDLGPLQGFEPPPLSSTSVDTEEYRSSLRAGWESLSRLQALVDAQRALKEIRRSKDRF